jgi:predicted cupin superfamily sugar epimerase
METQALIDHLGLQPHLEGGYFRRTFQPDHRDKIDTPEGPRFGMTSIYYLLTRDSPIGHWHICRSDIVHYFHRGSPLHYYLIHPDGHLQTMTMGNELGAGQHFQLVVKGGVWKATHLPQGQHALISEAVSPGFAFADMRLGERAAMLREFPQHAELINAYTRR